MIILGLMIITGLIRYSFLGLLQGRELPPRVRTALGFVPATVLPALVAPMIVFAPKSDALAPDTVAEPHRLLAALIALVAGMATRNMLAAILAGMTAFVALRAAGL
jgi:branched-subunit amino acid transport protein